MFGVDIVPCLQTLAHLKSVLKQPAFENYKDIDDILLLDDPKSKKLLQSLLKTVSECFSSGIVHLGMDEAMNLGRGRYLDLHGLVQPVEIMKRHLAWLETECTKLELKPMIWSDMYLEFFFGVEDYYGISEDAKPQNNENLSKNIALCYWDYQNETTDFYEKYIGVHQKLGNTIVFAGGAWTWNGIAPNVSKAAKTTRDALDACISKKIKDIFCTVWMDNGAETPLETCLPTLALYGEYGYGNRPTEEEVEQRFRSVFQRNYADYAILDAFDNIENKLNGSVSECNNKYAVNPSKTILYEDPLMGQFCTTFNEKVMKEHYKNLQKLLDLKETEDIVMIYYKTLAAILYIKANLSEEIKLAYKQKDKNGLKKNIQSLSEIETLTNRLADLRAEIWMRDDKPFGYEVLDIRMAGVSARCKSARHRIQNYLDEKIDSIPELEAIILPVRTEEMLQKEALHGYYIWDRIISNCNIDGI